MLQNSFQSFLATAGKQKLGLRISILAGLTNVILDFTLVGILKFGITGAAVATCASEFVGGFIPLIYFLHKITADCFCVPLPLTGKVSAKPVEMDLRKCYPTCPPPWYR